MVDPALVGRSVLDDGKSDGSPHNASAAWVAAPSNDSSPSESFEMVRIVRIEGPHLLKKGKVENGSMPSSFLWHAKVSEEIRSISTESTYKIAAISNIPGRAVTIVTPHSCFNHGFHSSGFGDDAWMTTWGTDRNSGHGLRMSALLSTRAQQSGRP